MSFDAVSDNIRSMKRPSTAHNFAARTFSILLLSAISISAQVRGGGGGGSVTAGVGKAYEASGKSAAAREMQRKMNTTLLRAIAREKGVKKQVQQAGSQGIRPRMKPGPAAPAIDSTFFKSDGTTDNYSALADSLGTSADEKAQLQLVFVATKDAFEKEVAAKGRMNNLAAAFTLFIATTLTIYHDDSEPSDQATDALWDGMSGALAEMPELARLSNAEKQQLNDMLVAFSGLLLAGYMEGKSSGDAETIRTFKTLAGALFETVLKTNPANLRFSAKGLENVN